MADERERQAAVLAEIRQDPYMHMVAHLVCDAWADGYAMARRELGAAPAEDPMDLHDMALLRLAERRSSAEAMLAAAALGGLVSGNTR